MASEQLLVNFFYAYPVGHAVEALHRCHGYHAADASLEISLVLNAESAVRLADFCPFVASAYGIAENPPAAAGSRRSAVTRRSGCEPCR